MNLVFYQEIELPNYCYLSEAVEFVALGRVPVKWEVSHPPKDADGEYIFGLDSRFDWREMPDNFEPSQYYIRTHYDEPEFTYAGLDMPEDYRRISELFKTHFESIAPEGIRVKVTPHHGGEPAVTPVDSDEYKAASKAMETTFGKTPIPLRSGGSIPIIAMFERVLGIKTVLFGFGLDSDAIHSPNEHFGLFNFYKGIETIPLFYDNYAALKSTKK